MHRVNSHSYLNKLVYVPYVYPFIPCTIIFWHKDLKKEGEKINYGNYLNYSALSKEDVFCRLSKPNDMNKQLKNWYMINDYKTHNLNVSTLETYFMCYRYSNINVFLITYIIYVCGLLQDKFMHKRRLIPISFIIQLTLIIDYIFKFL